MSEENSGAAKKDKDEISDNESIGDDPTMDAIRRFFAQKLHLGTPQDSEDAKKSKKVIDDVTFEGLAKHWKNKGFKNIITMVGAGISTSAGIPDFRSPGSGLYDNLQKYNLPHPSAIFELDYFEDNPKPFFALAKELYPGTFNPTISHYFVRLLHEKGLLVRHYTQNIDTLDRIAGIPEEKLVEAHGTFATNHCLRCSKSYSMEWMKDEIFSDRLPRCADCKDVVKPDIVFFGENLPSKFYALPEKDFKKCELLIIMGTSLEVQPFASLIDHARPNCLRLLINRTSVANYGSGGWFSSSNLFKTGHPSNTRDVAYIGDCDDGVLALAENLGWADELKALMKREHIRLDKELSQMKFSIKLQNHEQNSDEDEVEDNDKDVSKEKEIKHDEKTDQKQDTNGQTEKDDVNLKKELRNSLDNEPSVSKNTK